MPPNGSHFIGNNAGVDADDAVLQCFARGRRGLNHGRRNRLQVKFGVIGLRNHIGFIFKTEQRGEGQTSLLSTLWR